MTTAMVDPTCVSVHYMPTDGKTWAGYLCEKLRGDEYDIKCDLNDLTEDTKTALKSSKAKVNVVFVTPDFLDVQQWDWPNNIDKNSCILVLTGTEHDDLAQSASYHKSDHVLDFYIYELKETETSVRDLLIFIISKYEDTTDSSDDQNLHVSQSEPKDLGSSGKHNTEQRFRNHGNEASYKQVENIYRKHTLDKSHEDKLSAQNVEGPDDNYDVLPTLSRQVNGLRDVIYKDGKVYIFLWRRAESGLMVQLKDIELRPECTECAVYELPYEGEESTNISVTQDGEWLGSRFIAVDNTTDCANTSGELSNKSNSSLTSTNDQTTAQFYLSKTSSAQSVANNLVTVSVSTQTDPAEQTSEDGQTIVSESDTSRDSLYININDILREPITPTPAFQGENKLEYIREILEEVTDPEELLCRCLGIEKDVRQLDDKMSSMVQSIDTLRHLSLSGKRVYEAGPEEETSTWPTLIHFGAQFDLLNFCDVLLTNPLMYGACVRPNKDGYMPHDIARLHGHADLASMLQHFSEFVKAEKERDSGISGFSSTPRLSTITLLDEQPPPPHSHTWGDNYINMNKTELGHGDNENERDIEKLVKHKPRMRHLSQDLNYNGSSERDDDNILVLPAACMSTPTILQSPPFRNLANINDIVKIDPDKSTMIENDDAFEPEVEHHKDVQHQISPNNDKMSKASKIKKFFFYKKQGKKARSDSEPIIDTADTSNLRRKQAAKSYFRTSGRSSDTSSSTASTYSNSSVTMRDEDHTEIQLREDTKQAGKKKVTGFIKSAKRRQSVRIKTALYDQFAVPSLPLRGMISDGEF